MLLCLSHVVNNVEARVVFLLDFGIICRQHFLRLPYTRNKKTEIFLRACFSDVMHWYFWLFCIETRKRLMTYQHCSQVTCFVLTGRHPVLFLRFRNRNRNAPLSFLFLYSLYSRSVVELHMGFRSQPDVPQ